MPAEPLPLAGIALEVIDLNQRSMTTHAPTLDQNARGHGLISNALVTVVGIDSVIKGEAMSRLRLHAEHHLVDRIGWLRAAVLGPPWCATRMPGGVGGAMV